MKYFNIVLVCLALTFSVQAQTNREINVGDSASHPVVDDKNHKVYITQHILKGKLLIIDLAKNQVIKEIPVGSKPFWPILDISKQKIYILNRASSKINLIDIGNNNYSIKIMDINLPHNADAGAVLSDKFSRLYIPHNKEGKISVIDTKTQSLIKVIEAKAGIDGELTLADNDTILLLSHHSLGSISLVDLDF